MHLAICERAFSIPTTISTATCNILTTTIFITFVVIFRLHSNRESKMPLSKIIKLNTFETDDAIDDEKKQMETIYM